MTTPELELVWDGGSLNLMGENDTAYGPVTFAALSDGTDWGNPQSIRRGLFSALADGSASVTDRHDNRTVVVKLQLSAADSAALAGGEAPLHMLSTKQRAELRWTPPNDFAAPAVFVVVASDLAHDHSSSWDLEEKRCRRYYTLTLTCLPFARSIDPVAIEALAPFVAAPTTLDTCTSLTGWSDVYGGTTFALSGGGVEILGASAISDTVIATRSSKLTKTIARAKRYLAVEYELITGQLFNPASGPVTYVVTSVGGAIIAPPLVGAEGKWAFYDVSNTLGSITEIRFAFKAPIESPGVTKSLARILTIAESDAPALTAGRQSLRVIPTPGSARADGSLLIESRDATTAGAGTSLGKVIVYTGPQHDPRMSPTRANTPTADATALSGKQYTGTDHVFDRWARDFPPGSYTIWANVKRAAGSASVDWSINLRATNPQNLALVRDLGTITSPSSLVGTGYNLIPLGVMDLPGMGDASASILGLRFFVTPSTAVSLDELLFFNRTLGSLTIADTTNTVGVVESPPGTYTTTAGASRVWVDAPTLSSQGAVIAGRGVRGGSLPMSLATELLSWEGSHLFTPDATYMYLGTTGALDPKSTGEFRPGWHTHPAA